MKIYFLDDEAVNLKLIELLGKKETELDLNFFTSYEEMYQVLAQNQLENSLPNIIVTDIRMPGIDGFEVVKRVSSEFPDIKLMYCSAFSSLKTAIQEKSVEIEESLQRAYYVKPIRSDIFDMIKSL